jgi:hypothetical protein
MMGRRHLLRSLSFHLFGIARELVPGRGGERTDMLVMNLPRDPAKWISNSPAFIIAFCVSLIAPLAFGQGGPPMITDDPGTPGNRQWEINVAGMLERGSGENLFELPALDLNYGAGDHVQLKLEGAWLLRQHSESGTKSGLGNAAAGVKWRFLDEERNGLSMSIYPQIEWNMSSSSVRRDLVESGTHVILPAEIARRIGPFEFAAEAGYIIGINTEDEWTLGIIGAWPVSEKFELLAELHSDLPADFSSQQLTANLGTRIKISKQVAFLASVGHDLLSRRDEQRSIISYLGVQFTF